MGLREGAAASACASSLDRYDAVGVGLKLEAKNCCMIPSHVGAGLWLGQALQH
jgi:hypothetical protein